MHNFNAGLFDGKSMSLKKVKTGRDEAAKFKHNVVNMTDQQKEDMAGEAVAGGRIPAQKGLQGV